MNEWAAFFSQVLGFSQLVHFDDEAISTEYSALMSKVMQDGTGAIKFPINEPAEGRKKSQDRGVPRCSTRGPGVQHIACRTNDILATVTRLRENGVEFLHVPISYYEDLEQRVGTIDEPIDRLAELGILRRPRTRTATCCRSLPSPVEDQADAVLRDHRAARRHRLRRGQLQEPVRGAGARAGGEGEPVSAVGAAPGLLAGADLTTGRAAFIRARADPGRPVRRTAVRALQRGETRRPGGACTGRLPASGSGTPIPASSTAWRVWAWIRIAFPGSGTSTAFSSR